MYSNPQRLLHILPCGDIPTVAGRQPVAEREDGAVLGAGTTWAAAPVDRADINWGSGVPTDLQAFSQPAGGLNWVAGMRISRHFSRRQIPDPSLGGGPHRSPAQSALAMTLRTARCGRPRGRHR
jgi:hypothetical protein